MNIANKLSCGMSSASMLLYAMNSSTFTMSRKHEKSYKILKNTFFDDFFGRDFVVAVAFSFAQFFRLPTTPNSTRNQSLRFQFEYYAIRRMHALSKQWDSLKIFAIFVCTSGAIVFVLTVTQRIQCLCRIDIQVVGNRVRLDVTFCPACTVNVQFLFALKVLQF